MASKVIENDSQLCVPQDLTKGRLYLNKHFTETTLEEVKSYFNSSAYLDFLANKEDRIKKLKIKLQNLGLSYS